MRLRIRDQKSGQKEEMLLAEDMHIAEETEMLGQNLMKTGVIILMMIFQNEQDDDLVI